MSESLRDSAVDYLKEVLELIQEGKPENALKELGKAEEAAQKAKADDILLYVHTLKGRIMQTIETYEEALKIHVLTIKAAEELLSKDPDNELYQSSLQMNLDEIFTLGNRFYKMGRFLQAKNCCELHLLISQKLLNNDPENVGYQSNVGTTLNNLGILLKNMGRIEEAKQRYEKALEMREKLLKTDPENVGYQSDVAMTLNNLGILLKNMGRIEEAKQRYEESLEMREKLLKTDPENVGYQSNVGTTLNNLGNLLSNMGRIEEAKQRYEESLTKYTEPMQYLTIGKKSNAIMKLIELNTEQAEKETNSHRQIKYLEEVYQLCKQNQEFFSKYELKHERKLVTEAGLSAYIDFLMKNVRFETDSRKRAEEYEKTLQAVEKLGEIEDDETVSNLYSSAACFLRGRKLVNEALVSRKPELELLRQAVEQFKNAKETYNKANVCFCVYTALLKILEKIEKIDEINVMELKELIQKVVETLPDDVNSEIKASFESFPQIFEEKDKVTRKELLKKLDEKVSSIENKALENIFGMCTRGSRSILKSLSAQTCFMKTGS